MALNRNVEIERPDHTRLGVGNQGDPTAQEPESGKSVTRRGGTESEADINVGQAGAPRDLDGGANDFDSGPKNVGGSEAIAGQVISEDDATFNVEIDWLDSDENVVLTHNPSALQGVTDVDFNVISRSDRFKVRIEDASGGTNNVRGSINAH